MNFMHGNVAGRSASADGYATAAGSHAPPEHSCSGAEGAAEPPATSAAGKLCYTMIEKAPNQQFLSNLRQLHIYVDLPRCMDAVYHNCITRRPARVQLHLPGHLGVRDHPFMQNQFLEQLRQNHMAQQREAARQQQAAAADAHRQQDLQQRMLASLSAQQLQQLRSMPRVRLWTAQAIGPSRACGTMCEPVRARQGFSRFSN